jgi:3'-phosphoadenosine 5'-phosphosulfate sulfotransferase (PAPS reductase)/FAD synthetase
MKEKVHIVNLSGGKDSTAMLLGMIERDMPIDEILFFDWGKEFQGLYDHLEQLQDYVYQNIRKEIRFLLPGETFEYWLFEHEKKDSQYEHLGYGWPRAWSRWCTREKTKYFNRIVSQYKKDGFQFLGR